MRVTPIPDYLRRGGGEYFPPQIAGDRDTFRATPLEPEAQSLPLIPLALAFAAVALLVTRWRP